MTIPMRRPLVRYLMSNDTDFTPGGERRVYSADINIPLCTFWFVHCAIYTPQPLIKSTFYTLPAHSLWCSTRTYTLKRLSPHCTYQPHCVTIHTKLILDTAIVDPSPGPILAVPKPNHSLAKCANARAYAHRAN